MYRAVRKMTYELIGDYRRGSTNHSIVRLFNLIASPPAAADTIVGRSMGSLPRYAL
jgi:hypothetical protein